MKSLGKASFLINMAHQTQPRISNYSSVQDGKKLLQLEEKIHYLEDRLNA
jgi:hypothetical protein